ncbi:MAG: nucleoside kinase [Clostridia bacterium]|nr:nucleoside kinase [Clostridia bacterium]
MKENYTFGRINNLALASEKFLADSSKAYHEKIGETSSEIFSDHNKKIVMLAGPSSSGKTTTAKLLSESLNMLGGKAYTVSLDDFYLPRSIQYPLDENGEPDFECVEALDVELIHLSLQRLTESGKSAFPIFDFTTGERINNAKTIELRENDVIIVEGLHALNPIITDTLDESKLFRIYISVSSRVYENDGSVLLSKRDLRFIRRMVRDYKFRSMPVERTFEIWSSVMRGEDKYLFPFEGLADVKINSFHPCEPCIMSPMAIPLLQGVGGGFSEKADLLINKLKLFKNIDYSLLPENSLLREFTG